MTLYEIRRRNLEVLVKRIGTQSALAETIHRPANYISRVLSGRKRLGETLARHIEQRTGLPLGWLDMDHSQAERETSPSDLAARIAALPPSRRRIVYLLLGIEEDEPLPPAMSKSVEHMLRAIEAALEPGDKPHG